jgi:hypothetical protein
MTNREPLTPMQRIILDAMAEKGPAAFNGKGSRTLGFGLIPAEHGGIIVRAYGLPEWFLKARGLIERQDRNVPGIWFRITDKGRAARALGEQEHKR